MRFFSDLRGFGDWNASWLYATWLQFLIRYRRTALGPVWMVVGPALFIVVLGTLYGGIGGHAGADFVPFMALGLIVWTLLSGFVIASTTVYQRSRAQIMQGVALTDLIMIDVFSTVLMFAHQVVLLVPVFIYFGVPLTPYALVSLIGLALILVNGVWLTAVFGIIGIRYRDLTEIVQAIMRIAFLATPILWMPAANPFGRGDLLGVYLLLNPFHHFLELVRAPLLNQPIAASSWIVVLGITLAGSVLARLFHRRFAHFVPLWL